MQRGGVGEEARAGTEVAADTFHANKLAQARALHATYLPWQRMKREREREPEQVVGSSSSR